MTAARKEPGKQTFEEALRRLEQIVEHLEQGDVPLEQSIKMYEEGIALSRSCIERLNQAEIRLKRLSKDMEGNLQLFDEEQE